MTEKEKVSLDTAAVQSPPLPTQPPESAPTWSVPVQDVVLPSKGLVYPVESALHNRNSVEIRSMTAREEDILTSRALLRQGKAMSTLLRSCIMDKSVDPDDMLVGDRNAILIAIRASGYGVSYESKIECPECEASYEHEFNLGSFETKELKQDPVKPGENLFSFKLPLSGKEVLFKLLTGAEEKELSLIQERIKKAKGVGSVENNITLRLIHQIVSLDGVTDRKEIRNIVENCMLAGDSLALRKHIEKVSPGLDMTKFVTCPQCGEESEVEMAVGPEFFWPGTGK